MRVYDSNRPKGNFSIISNQIWRDKIIPRKVQNLYLFMWSCSDDFPFTVATLSKVYGGATATIAKYLRILEANGLIFRKQTREGGRFSKIEYKVIEVTIVHRVLKNGVLKSSTRSPLKVNNNRLKQEQKKKEEVISTPTPPSASGGGDNGGEIVRHESVRQEYVPRSGCRVATESLSAQKAPKMAAEIVVTKEGSSVGKPTGSTTETLVGTQNAPCARKAVANRPTHSRVRPWPKKDEFYFWLNFVSLKTEKVSWSLFHKCEAAFFDRDECGGVDADGNKILNWQRYFGAIIRKDIAKWAA